MLKRRLGIVLLVLCALSLACGLPLGPTATPSDPVGSAAEQTLNALRTDVAQSGVTSTPGVITATASPQAATLSASATPQPSVTTAVLPSATLTQVQVCDQATFVSDVTITDGTAINAGSPFTKIWRIRNSGTCTWTTSYAAVFESGDALGAAAAVPLASTVAPGQTIDISVPMTAPGSPGSYRGYWKLRNAAGVVFGVSGSTGHFYVDIKVVSVTPVSGGYNFATNVCQAEWSSGSKTLPCQGRDGDADGFVISKTNPILENGYVDDETALLTNPPRVNDGVIRGKFPPYTVRAGDSFMSIVGCEFNAKTCNLRFQLDYQIDNGAIQTLAAWNEAYEGNFSVISYNLDSLAGKTVRFILTVHANGASDNDRALWLQPRIAVQPPTATPTFTPTVTVTTSSYPAP